ncbi:MAG: CDP-diacylglycerol--glycerol-3-phosphate 3-phosphatidyltransferase [Leptospiraceae bacterium]|nr:CDP-diacylglycerol--glycerol-3-phosphate 3-phosphatidyltransferase [Leptospiraceae bacterium]
MLKKESNVNLPNFLTGLRIVLVPFFITFLFQEPLYYKIIAFCIFLFASLTDLVDGYLARKWNQETEFGKFLDPLADKVLVLGAFITFITLNEQVEVWMVFLIVLRDMLITTLRYIAIQNNQSIRTTKMAKLKTFFQMVAIIILLSLFIVITTGQRKNINLLFDNGKEAGRLGIEIANENFMIFIQALQKKAPEDVDIFYHLAAFLPYYVMLITTFITVLSGLRYLITNRELLKWKYISKALETIK